MEQKRPRSREKNVTSGGNGVHKRGDGLGTGNVGGQDYSCKKSSGGAKRAAAGGGGGILLLALVIMFLKGGVGGLLGSNTDKPDTSGHSASTETKVDNIVAKGSREKRTNIIGNNQDKITIMVYMCGTDLESKYKMASSDIEEMKSATLGKNIDIIIYTGGCSDWKSNNISSSVNQIYQIKDGRLVNLVSDDGAKSMTDPKTLSGFIKYCNANFPANRNELILWDHGGGSVSGYGYDEKYKSGGSMNLGGISQALKDGGVTFDFIGFDACLMATAETAFMLDDYADYLIASEETEPGIGWYYTDWLSKLGTNTSMPTVDIGKNIIDDFVTRCDQKCKGQKTTLSIIDLAEFSNTVPEKLNGFAQSVSSKIVNKEYEQISNARYNTREFAQSSKIDQIDLVNFAENVGTPEAKELSKVLKNAVKYNRTSSSITNAYGVSIYFPYQRTSYVDSACNIYSNIGMDSEYGNCIRQFAKIETSGQVANSSNHNSPLSSVFNMLNDTFVSPSSDTNVISELVSTFIKAPQVKNIDYMSDTSVSQENINEYISDNFFDTSNLVWEQNENGYFMSLPESQWKLVHKIDLNMFYDDGNGYIDLGLDNIYEFDGDGNLIPDTDRNWLAINGQPVAYYHTDTTEIGDDYTITGYVPAMLNGDRVNLILVFDNENLDGYIAGASTDYINGETDTIPKSMTEINVGDTLDFLCDFYNYNGEYQDSYYLGESMTVPENITISNVDVGDGEVKLMYRFTDIYNQEYWSEAITK
ncbi:MAG: clostripain-related cysteine peptidase [Ruminococcus flavefaciens]|nr:clostripain-related cysteine peptidase [Ruminococcus flavefaciens]